MFISRGRPSLAARAGGLLALVLPLWSAAYEEPAPVHNNLVLEGQLPGATLLRVQALDLKAKPLTVTLAEGRLDAGVHLEEGKGRRLSISATNADGKLLYQGEVQLDVNPDFIPKIELEFKSAVEGVSAGITLASHRVDLEFAGVEREGEMYTRITGDVFDADGRRLALEEGDLRWDIGDPWVREGLLPCPKSPGGQALCVEFLPPKSPFEFPVDACFRDRICVLEYAPPIVPVWREVAVSMGGHGCALKLNGDLYCWGQGEHGQLGYVAPKECDSSGLAGSRWGCSGYAQPVVCASGPCNFKQVTAGIRHTCAIDANQDAWCWGDNYNGELGLDTFDPTHIGSPQPRMVFGGLKFLSIRAALTATCGLTTSHQVYCWGNNASSVIPPLAWGWANDPRLVPTAEPIADLDFSSTHACGRVNNGNLYCWGTSTDSELGSLSWTSAPQCSTCPAMPLLMQANIPALANQQVSLVSTGNHGTCAHTTSGKTPCWGWSLPSYPAGRSLDRLSRGFQHYCTITRGIMECAGLNALGDGSEEFGDPGIGPVKVKQGSLLFRELDTGNGVTCAIANDENVYCWGRNGYAQLGLGKPGGIMTTPTALLFPTTLKIPPPHTWLP